MNKKVALITGAANGMGRSFAKKLAEDGFSIAIWDRVSAEEVCGEIAGNSGKAIAYTVDLNDVEQIQNTGDKVINDFGRVDVIVNNAGIYPNLPLEDIGYDEWRRVMSLNLDAPFLVCKRFIDGMRQRKYGRIINISSSTIGVAIPGFVHYVASKMGVIGLTRGLASEVGADGVTVNALAPGLTRTTGMMDPNRRGPNGATYEQEVNFVKTLQAIPRAQEIDDLTGAVSFLASEESRFMTGQTLVVDGGLVRL